MVEPIHATRSQIRALTFTSFVLLISGCSFVPKSKLEECHRVSQNLRADNNRLKDVALDLRSQNQDLSQRAVEDARRLSAQDEAVERLERSVAAYQSERDKMAAAFEAVKRQVRMAVSPHPASLPVRLKAFADAHPGWTFDEKGTTLVAAPEALFTKGSSELKPEAVEAIKALGSELSNNADERPTLEIVGQSDASPVVRAGFDSDADKDKAAVAAASGRFMSAARAARVRDRLVTTSGLDPAQARLAPPTTQHGNTGGVEIRLHVDTETPKLSSPPPTELEKAKTLPELDSTPVVDP